VSRGTKNEEHLCGDIFEIEWGFIDKRQGDAIVSLIGVLRWSLKNKTEKNSLRFR